MSDRSRESICYNVLNSTAFWVSEYSAPLYIMVYIPAGRSSFVWDSER